MVVAAAVTLAAGAAGGVAVGTSRAYAGAGATGFDVTGFQQDAQHDGVVQGGGFDGPLALKWDRALAPSNDGASDHATLSTPVVVGSSVVVEYLTSSGVTVSALAASDGHTLWSTVVPGGFPGNTMAADGGRVFVKTNTTLAALDVASGSIDWSEEQDSVTPTGPTAADGRVGSTLSASVCCTFTTFYEADGAGDWSVSAPGEGVAATSADGTWYPAVPCELDRAEKGTLTWRDGGCYTGGTGTSAYAAGSVWLASSQINGSGPAALTGFDPATGAVTRKLVGDSGGTYGAPAIGYGVAAAFNSSGLDVWNLSDGTLRWVQAASLSVYSAPLVTSDSVLWSDAAGRLHETSLSTGKDIWTGAADQAQTSVGIAATNGTAYVSAYDGHLRAWAGTGATPSPTASTTSPTPAPTTAAPSAPVTVAPSASTSATPSAAPSVPAAVAPSAPSGPPRLTPTRERQRLLQAYAADGGKRRLGAVVAIRTDGSGLVLVARNGLVTTDAWGRVHTLGAALARAWTHLGAAARRQLGLPLANSTGNRVRCAGGELRVPARR